MGVVLDFACGHGRIAAKVSELAGKLMLCGINKDAIEFCKDRFLSSKTKCKFKFIVNNNKKIPIWKNSVTFIYSWDAMVHFEQEDLEIYAGEFYRILKKGKYGFIHHSNDGGLEESEKKSHL